MSLLFMLLASLCVSQGFPRQLDKKQFVNLGDSFNYGGEDTSIEDGYSRGLSDNSLGGELGMENSPSSQMHLTENNQGGLSLGDNVNNGLGGLGALLGGNSLNSFSSMNSMSSMGGNDDLGLGLGDVNAGIYGKDSASLDALGAGKDIFGSNDQITSEFTNNGKSDGNSDAASLLAAFGLGGKTESKGGSDSILDGLAGVQGDKQQPLIEGLANLQGDKQQSLDGLANLQGDKQQSLDSLANLQGDKQQSLDGLANLQGDKQQSLLSLLNLGKSSSSSENSQAKTDLGQSTPDDSLNGLNMDIGNSNSNIENTANLGDSLTANTNTDLLGLSKNDLATLLGGSPPSSSQSSSGSSGLANALKNIKGSNGINDGSIGVLQKLLSGSTTSGDDRQGIGDFGEGNLSSELSQLDMTDEKLEKMLEGGKIGGGGNTGESTGSDSESLDSQPAPDELPGMGYHGQMHPMQQQMSPMLGSMMAGMGPMQGMGMPASGGMGGTGGAGGMGSIDGGYGNMMGHHQNLPIEPGVTVHAHASDKPGHTQSISPAEAAKPAKQVQQAQRVRHEEKLRKLKQRLNNLKDKLNELEEEQSKKSHDINNPAAKRKDAIKKLLIKNLKLAALIASKEIQLEEEKQSAFTAKKKESDDLGLIDIPSSHSKDDNDILAFSKTKAKPLTDLSKKAEDEVNHLTKSRNDKNKAQRKEASADKKGVVAGNEAVDNSTIIKQINATLAKLSENSSRNATVSPKAYRRLVQRITQMSPKKSEAVQEAALTSLYKSLMKTKKENTKANSKKLAINYVNVGCYKDKEKRLLSSLESSFKSPLDKNYKSRLNALYKCARIAKLKGLPGFAIENGGQCFGGKGILKKYQQYGPSLACNENGKGGPWSLNIYKLV